MINIKSDSRKVIPGDTFIALKGLSSDGHDFIEAAIERGATKIICEHGSYVVPTEVVSDTRTYLLDYLVEHYQHNINKMILIGITGTNGKTTSAYLLYEMLQKLGKKVAYIGTLGFFIDHKICSLANTTPEFLELYDMMMEAYQVGVAYVIMETSSQGLAYERVEGILFDYAIFTNLSQDHLDYHKTMENYALAKQKLFHKLKPHGKAIINYDDSFKGTFLLPENHNITYGFHGGDYQVKQVAMHSNKTLFSYEYQGTLYHITSSLIGNYNVYNLMVAIVVLLEMGVSYEDLVSITYDLKGPSGRLETIDYQNNCIVIDYAHTADAIEKIIGTIRGIITGDIYTVFGCTGDRDRLKRPIMTKLVTDNSKYAILTSDDLHNESFDHIISDMIEGLDNTNYEICEDRRLAIEKGIQLLKGNDALLILGKGHEEVMIVKDKQIPFQDRKVVEALLEQYNS